MSTAAIWHDVECGSYSADLELWEELAERSGDPVLELGCGTGRVALHLARRGNRVLGLDRDPQLIAALAARRGDLPVEPVAADACDFRLDDRVSLVLAPMQFLQLLDDSAARVACLARVAESLRPGGLLAAAIVEEMPEADGAMPPLPDVRDVDGWVYSSLPTEAAIGPGEIVLRRLRQTVSPTGELSEEPNEVRIRTFPAARLEAEAAAAGLVSAGRHTVLPTDAHVGSIVVVLERTR
jgi:SAM-dependent methyltransferase